jgi:hypothetical protein
MYNTLKPNTETCQCFLNLAIRELVCSFHNVTILRNLKDTNSKFLVSFIRPCGKKLSAEQIEIQFGNFVSAINFDLAKHLNHNNFRRETQ